MNLHGSVLLAFHEYIDRLPVGEHPRICSLVSGVFNVRSPNSKYMFVLDVKQVLDFVKDMFGIMINYQTKN